MICPFCGGKAEINGRVFATCLDCGKEINTQVGWL